jgi:Helix-turn-helix domain
MDHVSVDGYVLDSLMPDLVGHDRLPSAFLVYLYLWRRTRGGARSVVASYPMMVDGTGLSQRSVQTAVRALERRGLVAAKRPSATSPPSFTLVCHWRDRKKT